MIMIREDIHKAGNAMRDTLTENVINGMATAEGEFDLGDGFLCVSIDPTGADIMIYDRNGNEKTNLPNLEDAVRRAMPTYDGVVDTLEAAREERDDDRLLYRGLCMAEGLSIQW